MSEQIYERKEEYIDDLNKFFKACGINDINFNSTSEEIARAVRKAKIKLHPDQHKGEEAKYHEYVACMEEIYNKFKEFDVRNLPKNRKPFRYPGDENARRGTGSSYSGSSSGYSGGTSGRTGGGSGYGYSGSSSGYSGGTSGRSGGGSGSSYSGSSSGYSGSSSGYSGSSSGYSGSSYGYSGSSSGYSGNGYQNNGEQDTYYTYYTNLLHRMWSVHTPNYIELTRKNIAEAIMRGLDIVILFKRVYQCLQTNSKVANPERNFGALMAVYMLYFNEENEVFQNQINDIINEMTEEKECYIFFNELYYIISAGSGGNVQRENAKNKAVNIWIYLISSSKIENERYKYQYCHIFEKDEQIIKLINDVHTNKRIREDVLYFLVLRIGQAKRKDGTKRKFGGKVLYTFLQAVKLEPYELFEFIEYTNFVNDDEIIQIISLISNGGRQSNNGYAYTPSDIFNIMRAIVRNNEIQYGFKFFEYAIKNFQLPLDDVCQAIARAKLEEFIIDKYLDESYLNEYFPQLRVASTYREVKLALYNKKINLISQIQDQDERIKRYNELKAGILNQDILTAISRKWDKEIDPNSVPKGFFGSFFSRRKPQGGTHGGDDGQR